jgi:phage/plasmid primase-like uncharacterized protein
VDSKNNAMSTDTWIAAAKAVRIEQEIERRGIRLKGRRERVGPCPVCGGHDRFGINTSKQVFNCRGCGKAGDVIALVQHFDGVDFRTACETLTGEKRPTNGRTIELPDGTELAALAAQHKQHMREQARRDDEDQQYENKQREKARRLWNTSKLATGTIVETYLRSRCIAVPLPATIRFLPANGLDRHPAMVVPYALPSEPEPGELAVAESTIAALHLTLLRPDGSGKADVEPNKITVGSPAGRPLVLAPMNDLMGLAVTEGIEDALSVHQATGLGAWAAGSAGYMPSLVAAIEHLAGREEDASPDCVTIFADADKAGRHNARALADALTTLSTRLAIPPATQHFEVLLNMKDPTS